MDCSSFSTIEIMKGLVMINKLKGLLFGGAKTNKWVRKVFIAFLAFLNALAFGYILNKGDTSYIYLGTSFYGWNPACIAFFTLDCILLSRFFQVQVLQNKNRMILSSVLGILLGLSAVWGTYLIYTGEIFSPDINAGLSTCAVIGLSFFTIPLFSELVGFFDSVQEKSLIGKKDDKAENSIIYFFVIWLIVFASFIPMFLYYWPVNVAYDAGYQVFQYMTDTVTTHHPILHTLLLGWAYNIGYENGDVNKSIQIYTIIQMVILSGSFAFFMKYLKDKNVIRPVRVIILLIFILNPVNSYFAISTVKGVLCAAFTILAMVFLMRAMDRGISVSNMIMFVIAAILACMFRNNMPYAIVVAGIIIALLRKKWKEKIVYLSLIVVVFTGYKAFNSILIWSTNATNMGVVRESMSVPLNCLARAALNHQDDMPDDLYSEIIAIIPETTLPQYSLCLADTIKNTANEKYIGANKLGFIKLVIKVGLRYPGEYIEAIGGLTLGYWYCLDEPYILTGTTKLNDMSIQGDYPGIANRNLLPFGSELFDYMYGKEDGRLQMPLIGWAWRPTIYVWGFLFALGYAIYKRNNRKLTLLMIPFMYLCTCFLGPVSWMRYIYINVAAFPIMIYLLMEPSETR